MIEKKLVYTFDDNYFIPFLVSAYSAKLQFGSNLTISIVQPESLESEMGLSQDALNLCISCLKSLNVDFEIVRVDTESFPEDELPLWARFPKTTWLRYYYIFNADIAREIVYYVEADMLFVRNEPSIFDVKLQSKAVAARTSPGHEEFETKWGPNLAKPWYFNCGVMIIDVEMWRSHIKQADWWKIISSYKKMRFEVIEQDALNYVFLGNHTPINFSLNTYPSEFDHKNTALLHFAGHHKPWNFRPKLLRIKLSRSVRKSMKLWDSVEAEILESLQLKLPHNELRALRNYYPKVRLSSRTSIFFPRSTSKLFALMSYIKKIN